MNALTFEPRAAKQDAASHAFQRTYGAFGQKLFVDAVGDSDDSLRTNAQGFEKRLILGVKTHHDVRAAQTAIRLPNGRKREQTLSKRHAFSTASTMRERY